MEISKLKLVGGTEFVGTSPGGRTTGSDVSRRAKDKHPLRPEKMEAICRRLAADIRRTGERVNLTADGKQEWITAKDAADSMERQADRWKVEVEQGICNRESRQRLGEPVW